VGSERAKCLLGLIMLVASSFSDSVRTRKCVLSICMQQHKMPLGHHKWYFAPFLELSLTQSETQVVSGMVLPWTGHGFIVSAGTVRRDAAASRHDNGSKSTTYIELPRVKCCFLKQIISLAAYQSQGRC
jgi:hypothetical protein